MKGHTHGGTSTWRNIHSEKPTCGGDSCFDYSTSRLPPTSSDSRAALPHLILYDMSELADPDRNRSSSRWPCSYSPEFTVIV